MYRPVFKSWRLNERMYGALEGSSKLEAAVQHGEEQVMKWSHDLHEQPPIQTPDHPFWHGNERKYADLKVPPVAESLADTMERTGPLWSKRIEQALNDGQNVLVVAHGNSLRGLVKHIENLSVDDIKQVEIPNGIPLIYNFERVKSNQKVLLRPVREEASQSPIAGEFLVKKGLFREVLQREKDKAMGELGKVDGLLQLDSERKQMGENLSDSQHAVSDDKWQYKGLKKLLKKEGPQPSMTGNQLVIIRHGKTSHNKLGLFTGWEDVPLANEGRQEAIAGGKLLRKHGVTFDVVYTSWLQRAIETAWLVIDELDALWLPMIKSWRLNERMYGALTGLSKVMIKERHGDAQFKAWRRGYDIPPPSLDSFSSHYPGNDERYQKYVKDIRYSFKETVLRSISQGRIELHRKFPVTESLKDCMDRTLPYLVDDIMPEFLEKNKSVLVASSENAIRGILMYLMEIPKDRISEVEIPTGLPMIYDLKGKRIRLLDDGTDADILTKYNFGSAPELLFKPCSEDDDTAEECVLVGGRAFSYDPLIRLPEIPQ